MEKIGLVDALSKRRRFKGALKKKRYDIKTHYLEHKGSNMHSAEEK